MENFGIADDALIPIGTATKMRFLLSDKNLDTAETLKLRDDVSVLQ
jgi:hypothetical protein